MLDGPLDMLEKIAQATSIAKSHSGSRERDEVCASAKPHDRYLFDWQDRMASFAYDLEHLHGIMHLVVWQTRQVAKFDGRIVARYHRRVNLQQGNGTNR